MRYVRHVEDDLGSLVEVLYYCSRLCYAEEPNGSVSSLPGGWWPCLDSELEVPEPCRVCGQLIGPGDFLDDASPKVAASVIVQFDVYKV